MRKITIPLAALMLAATPFVALHSSAAYAQDMSQGADNFYKSDKVTIEKVTFRNKLGMKVAGNLFTPKTLDRSARAPAIIVGHPMGAVKEQSANLYATKLAEQGFVTRRLISPSGARAKVSRATRSRLRSTSMISARRSISSAHRLLSTRTILVCWASAAAAALR